ncbi:MAG: helix-turn-helix transcriptional regulator [Clostridia bacterium]|nr:helix-turn-helix transcriptional regulator [Clostridia bacterium]
MKDSFKTPFSRKLKTLRLERGISQKDLARDLGISRSCLANYETGKRQPDNEMLIRIADKFQVLVDYLVDRTEYKNISLSMHEIEECCRVWRKFENQRTSLDLSTLDLEGKIAVAQYYDYIDLLIHAKQL